MLNPILATARSTGPQARIRSPRPVNVSVIRIFYDDHNPPHFHAEYGGYEVLVDIGTLAVLSGKLPARALGMVTEWASLHQDELRAA